MTIARVLIIAGSDSGGGAGIQADIKTVTMLGGHAMTAITAITAQNTTGVTAAMPVPVDMVLAQINACISDIGVDAVKIGMIGGAGTAEVVADRLAELPVPIVFDPVMVATSGSMLADAATIAAFGRLMQIATVVTPNAPELAALGGDSIAAEYGCTVLAKGGDEDGPEVLDRLFNAEGEIARWTAPRIETRHTHGTGCTLASAIATFLAQGLSLPAAITSARHFVRLALKDAPGLGSGHGPMGHASVRLDLGPEMRLNQVTLGCSDFAASKAFYLTLGLTLIVDAPEKDYARFEAPGGATLSIHPGSEPGAAIYFECNDLDEEVARLRAASMIFESDPVAQSWLWREAWTTDPHGNHICLYQAGENRRYPPWRIP